MGIYQRKKRFTFTCKSCGKEFELTQSAIDQGRGTFCSRECQLSEYSGDGNPNYKHGYAKLSGYYKAMRLDLEHTLTWFEWEETKKVFSYRCAYCGKKETENNKLEMEHIIPASRGGGFTKENIIPACRKCNMKKFNHTPEEKGMRILEFSYE